MTIAIIGNGALGLAIRDEFIADGIDVRVISHSELDISRPKDVASVLSPYSLAINTAAFHRLSDCEQQPSRARAVNTLGAAHVAMRCPTIFISTDYVFSGQGPHPEWTPPRPVNVYGRTKAGGEIATLRCGGVVVRVASLFGPYPSRAKPSLVDRARASTEHIVTLPHQRITPSYAPDVARDVLHIAKNYRHFLGRILHSVIVPSVYYAELWELTRSVFGLPSQQIRQIPLPEWEPPDGVLRPWDSRLSVNFLPRRRTLLDALLDLKRRLAT